MSMTEMAWTCEEAAHQHDRAAAHYRRSARHLANAEHTAAQKERDLALSHSEMAPIEEAAPQPDGIVHDRRSAAEAAWHFMD
jgi:hypothetical protein